jgi:hypothetical protein
VRIEDGELIGEALVDLARLLDAPAVREALAAAPESATVALVASGHIYDEVIRHRHPGIDPDTYRRIEVQVKETSTRAWLHIPGHTPGAPASSAATQPPGRAGRSGGFTITADSVNIASDDARAGRQLGRVSTYIEHAGGGVGLSTPDLAKVLAELRRLLAEHRSDLDAETYDDATAQLADAEAHAAACDDAGRRAFIRALQRLKGLVEGTADLVAKVSAAIAAARGAR